MGWARHGRSARVQSPRRAHPAATRRQRASPRVPPAPPPRRSREPGRVCLPDQVRHVRQQRVARGHRARSGGHPRQGGAELVELEPQRARVARIEQQQFEHLRDRGAGLVAAPVGDEALPGDEHGLHHERVDGAGTLPGHRPREQAHQAQRPLQAPARFQQAPTDVALHGVGHHAADREHALDDAAAEWPQVAGSLIAGSLQAAVARQRPLHRGDRGPDIARQLVTDRVRAP